MMPKRAFAGSLVQSKVPTMLKVQSLLSRRSLESATAE
jgi:hypothetical protein